MTNPTCPFCGIEVRETVTGNKGYFNHPSNECGFSYYNAKKEDWERRPGKDEKPSYRFEHIPETNILLREISAKLDTINENLIGIYRKD